MVLYIRPPRLIGWGMQSGDSLHPELFPGYTKACWLGKKDILKTLYYYILLYRQKIKTKIYFDRDSTKYQCQIK